MAEAVSANAHCIGCRANSSQRLHLSSSPVARISGFFTLVCLSVLAAALWPPPAQANCIDDAKAFCHANGARPIEWHCGFFNKPPHFADEQDAVDYWAAGYKGPGYLRDQARAGCSGRHDRCYLPRKSKSTLWEYMQFQCGERKYFVTAEFENDIDTGKECHSSCEAGDPITGDGAGVGNPILVASGQKVEVTTDYRSAVPGGLSLVRYYASGTSSGEGLGAGWRHTYMREIADVYTQAPPTHDPSNPRHSLLYDSPEQACIQGWPAIKREMAGPDGKNTSTQWVSNPECSLSGYCQLRDNGATRGRIKIYDNVNTRPAFVPDLIAKRITLGNGRVLTFTRVDGQWESDPDIPAELIETATGFELHTSTDTVESFDQKGRLISITDRQGRTTDIAYSNGHLATVTGAYGRTLTFNYNAEGSIASIATPDGRSIRYEYGPNDNLSTVIYPDDTPATSADNPRVQLHYEDLRHPHALTGLTDERGQRFATWTYDDTGRAISSERALGAERMNVTALSDREVRVTDSLGVETLYSFKVLHGTRRVENLKRKACNTCPVQSRTFTYDANGFVASRSDFNGNMTQFVHNDRGLETRRTQAAGTGSERTVTTQWHPDFRLPIQVEEPGRRTAYTYDSSGNRLTETVTDTATGENRRTTWTYNASGLVTSVDGPRTDVSDVTTYDYDSQGNLTAVTDALGHTTQITRHDAHGNPLRMVDPNGVETVLTYDARQRLSSRSIDGVTTQFTYDDAGLLIAVTLPSGATLSYQYDAAHRLVAIEDHDGNRIEYTLDAMGNRSSQEIRDIGGTMRYAQQQVFNQLSRLKEILGNNGQSTRYDYDANGNPTAVTEAGLYSTLHQFDALDRLTEISDAESGETVFKYDALGNLVSVTDPEGLTTSYTYNAFGDLIELYSPDTGAIAYAYDKAGNRVSKTDARGVTVTYSYDALDRPLLADYPGSEVDIAYHYDGRNYGATYANGLGRLTGTAKSDGTTTYIYDGRGNLVQQNVELFGNTYDTSYQYDGNDNITEIVYPSGRTIGYRRDVSGRVTEVSATLGNETQILAEQIAYLPFGGIQSLTLGNGQTVDMDYDLDYRLNGKQVPGLIDLQWAYDARDNITSITDRLGQIQDQRFIYDALSRLTQAQGTYGTIGYTYDSVGNRLSRTRDGNVETFTYAPDSHRLQSIANSSGTTTAYTYDATGNTLTSGGEREYSYDAAGRLTRVNGAETVYLDDLRYNAQGQRFYANVIKGKRRNLRRPDRGEGRSRGQSHRMRSNNSSKTSYHYDRQGRLIAEISVTGTPMLREYVYLDGVPLAMFARQPQPQGVSYFHTDHLGTPQLLTDSAGTVVWRGQYLPFGEVTVTTEAVVNPLRFPGQRDDGISGTNYNYYRDYLPEIGRYIQSDPIGLVSGINTYAYVGSNPLKWIDPYGLEVLVGQHPAFVDSPRNPFNHMAIVLKPDRPQDFRSHPLFADTNGRQATLGGQAFGNGLGLFGRLQGAFNHPGDNPDNLRDLNTVCAPEGKSDTEFINSLISIAEAYDNTALYDPFPDHWGLTYNSNSYVSGLLRAAGATPPVLPGTAPGYNRPLPFNDFRN